MEKKFNLVSVGFAVACILFVLVLPYCSVSVFGESQSAHALGDLGEGYGFYKFLTILSILSFAGAAVATAFKPSLEKILVIAGGVLYLLSGILATSKGAGEVKEFLGGAASVSIGIGVWIVTLLSIAWTVLSVKKSK